MIILRTPDKKLSLTKEEAMYFLAYLDSCKNNAFNGINFFKHQQMRELFMKFHLTTFSEKLLTKYFNATHKNSKHKLTIPVNYAEELTLPSIFQRVEASPFILAVQQKILLTLRTSYCHTEIKPKSN